MRNLKERDKQNNGFTMSQSNKNKENEDKQDPWAKYGNLVKRDNIANEDGVINLMADNLLYDYSTGGVVLVDSSLLKSMTEVTKQNVAAMPNAKQIGKEDNNSHSIIAQTKNCNNIIRDKHDAIAKTVAQNSKDKFSPDKSKETIAPAKEKYDGQDIWNGYIGVVDKVNTMAKPIEGFETYNDSAMAYNKKNIQNGSVQNKLLTKDELVKFTKEIDNTTIYNTVKKVSTLPIGKTLTAVDITNTCNVIVDDWVKNGTLTEETGKEIMSFFATEAGLRLTTSLIMIRGAAKAKTNNKNADGIVTSTLCALAISLLYANMEAGMENVVDFVTSEPVQKYFQEIAEKNSEHYQQEQKELEMSLKKQKENEEKLKYLQRIAIEKDKQNKLDKGKTLVNSANDYMLNLAEQNLKRLSDEDKAIIEYYLKLAKEVNENN